MELIASQRGSAAGCHLVDAESPLDSCRDGNRYRLRACRPTNHHSSRAGWDVVDLSRGTSLLRVGAALGYPALRLSTGGPAVRVQVLTTASLRAAWPDLDAFEGAEYRRVLVPVWTSPPGERALITVANLYEASQEQEL